MSQMPGKGINAQKQAGKNNPAPGSKDHIFSISCVYPAPPDSYESWNHRLHLGVIMIFLNSWSTPFFSAISFLKEAKFQGDPIIMGDSAIALSSCYSPRFLKRARRSSEIINWYLNTQVFDRKIWGYIDSLNNVYIYMIYQYLSIYVWNVHLLLLDWCDIHPKEFYFFSPCCGKLVTMLSDFRPAKVRTKKNHGWPNFGREIYFPPPITSNNHE